MIDDLIIDRRELRQSNSLLCSGVAFYNRNSFVCVNVNVNVNGSVCFEGGLRFIHNVS